MVLRRSFDPVWTEGRSDGPIAADQLLTDAVQNTFENCFVAAAIDLEEPAAVFVHVVTALVEVAVRTLRGRGRMGLVNPRLGGKVFSPNEILYAKEGNKWPYRLFILVARHASCHDLSRNLQYC